MQSLSLKTFIRAANKKVADGGADLVVQATASGWDGSVEAFVALLQKNKDLFDSDFDGQLPSLQSHLESRDSENLMAMCEVTEQRLSFLRVDNSSSTKEPLDGDDSSEPTLADDLNEELLSDEDQADHVETGLLADVQDLENSNGEGPVSDPDDDSTHEEDFSALLDQRAVDDMSDEEIDSITLNVSAEHSSGLSSDVSTEHSDHARADVEAEGDVGSLDEPDEDSASNDADVEPLLSTTDEEDSLDAESLQFGSDDTEGLDDLAEADESSEAPVVSPDLTGGGEVELSEDNASDLNDEVEGLLPEADPVLSEELPVSAEIDDMLPEADPVLSEELPVSAEIDDMLPEADPVLSEELPVSAEIDDLLPEADPVLSEELPVSAEIDDLLPEADPVSSEELPVSVEIDDLLQEAVSEHTTSDQDLDSSHSDSRLCVEEEAVADIESSEQHLISSDTGDNEIEATIGHEDDDSPVDIVDGIQTEEDGALTSSQDNDSKLELEPVDVLDAEKVTEEVIEPQGHQVDDGSDLLPPLEGGSGGHDDQASLKEENLSIDDIADAELTHDSPEDIDEGHLGEPLEDIPHNADCSSEMVDVVKESQIETGLMEPQTAPQSDESLTDESSADELGDLLAEASDMDVNDDSGKDLDDLLNETANLAASNFAHFGDDASVDDLSIMKSLYNENNEIETEVTECAEPDELDELLDEVVKSEAEAAELDSIEAENVEAEVIENQEYLQQNPLTEEMSATDGSMSTAGDEQSLDIEEEMLSDLLSDVTGREMSEDDLTVVGEEPSVGLQELVEDAEGTLTESFSGDEDRVLSQSFRLEKSGEVLYDGDDETHLKTLIADFVMTRDAADLVLVKVVKKEVVRVVTEEESISVSIRKGL